MRMDARGFSVLILLATAGLNLPAAPGRGQSLFHTALPGARAAALGQTQTAAIHDPVAALWNPAALAFMRDAQFRISADSPFSFNYLGVSQFFPLVGIAALGLAEYPLKYRIGDGGTSAQEVNAELQRLTLAMGRGLSDRFFAGAAVHVNRLNGDDFATFSLGAIFFPSFHEPIASKLVMPDRLFNPFMLPRDFALAVSIQDVRLGRHRLGGFADFGSYLRLMRRGPVLHATLRTNGRDERTLTGLGFPLTQKLNFFTGTENFAIKNMAFGVSLQAVSHSIDIAYSLPGNDIMVDFAVRLGKSAIERAESHKRRSLALARRGAYEEAEKETRRYLDYVAVDTTSMNLRRWLVKKLNERQTEIQALLDKARGFESKQWYISATLTYLNILDLDANNKLAYQRLKVIKPKADANIHKLYEQAVLTYDQGYYEQAQRAFRAVLLVQKDHTGAQTYLARLKEHFEQEAEELYWRGLGFYTQKKYDEAIRAFRKAIAYKDNYEEAQQYLKKAIEDQQAVDERCRLLLARALDFQKKKNYLRAYETYLTVLELDPLRESARKGAGAMKPYVENAVNRHLVRGKDAYQRGRYDAASSEFRQVLEIDGGNQIAADYLSRIHQRQVKDVDSEYQRGLNLLAQKDWENAIEAFDQVLGMVNGTHEDAREKRREAYSHSRLRELLDEAEGKFQNKDYLAARYLYGLVLERDSTISLAMERFQACQEILDRELDRHFNRGIAFYTNEKYRDAIREWEEALRINPSHAQSLAYKKKAEQRLMALQQLP